MADRVGVRSLGLLSVLLLVVGGGVGALLAQRSGPDRESVVSPHNDSGRQLSADVGGALVRTNSIPIDLVDEAQVVEFTLTVIDDGDGFEACLSGVGLSDPPTCSGPTIDGLEEGDWTTEREGVRWGDRTITVQWPPVDNRLTLLGAGAPVAPAPFDDLRTAPEQLPAACEELAEPVPLGTMLAYADSHPETVGLGWTIDDMFVLPVRADAIDEARTELRNGSQEPCLIRVEWSWQDLQDAQLRLNEITGSIGPVVASRSGSVANLLLVQVPVADRATINAVLAQVDVPEMIVITGRGVVLA